VRKLDAVEQQHGYVLVVAMQQVRIAVNVDELEFSAKAS